MGRLLRSTDRAIDALLEIISSTLEKSESLSLVGFGSFEVGGWCARSYKTRYWRCRRGRNRVSEKNVAKENRS